MNIPKMTHTIYSKMPYMEDLDYQEAFIHSIMSVIKTPIETTLIEYGQVDVSASEGDVEILNGMPTIGKIRKTCADQMCTTRSYIIQE